MSRAMQTSTSSAIGAGRRQQRSTDSGLRRVAAALRVWILRRRTRKQLGDLDPHLLEDIGITQAQARTEANRPFWHG